MSKQINIFMHNKVISVHGNFRIDKCFFCCHNYSLALTHKQQRGSCGDSLEEKKNMINSSSVYFVSLAQIILWWLLTILTWKSSLNYYFCKCNDIFVWLQWHHCLITNIVVTDDFTDTLDRWHANNHTKWYDLKYSTCNNI